MPRPFIPTLAALFILLLPGRLTAAHWAPLQAERLAQWLDSAQNEALPAMDAQASAVRAALEAHDTDRIDRVATASALDLARRLRFGSSTTAQRTAWHIVDDPDPVDPEARLAAALAADRLDQYLAGMRPAHPWYGLLQRAYVDETDPARRATLALNMERWRWMPRELGARYLLVNTATFELTLWDKGRAVQHWAVVVGKTSTPTPVFATRVTGIIFNPWWEIPDSIAQESVAALVRDHPAEARRKGYVYENGRYRQRPGPQNALGQMKLVMPNDFSVYLHDSPSRALFTQNIRAFSHGCVRVDGALGLAETLLADRGDWPRSRIDATIAAGKTANAPLAQPLPVYIAYFTAEPEEGGKIRILPDLYRRDQVGFRDASSENSCTG